MRVLCTIQNDPTSFLFYHFAKFIWTSVHIAFNIQKYLSVLHLFDDWASAGVIISKIYY
jgi:hypothetical protein